MLFWYNNKYRILIHFVFCKVENSELLTILFRKLKSNHLWENFPDQVLICSKLITILKLSTAGQPAAESDGHTVRILQPSYLSGLLKVLTGQSTQQRIGNELIEQAKEQLSTIDLSVSEIAYALGFEHPQPFGEFLPAFLLNRHPGLL